MAEKSEGHKLRLRILDRLAKDSHAIIGGRHLSDVLWLTSIQAMDDLYHLHWKSL